MATIWTKGQSLSDHPKQVSVTLAKGQLTELVRRAEAGHEICYTRHGHPAVRLVPVRTPPDRTARRVLLDSLPIAARSRATPGPSAAHSPAFLYNNDDGFPE